MGWAGVLLPQFLGFRLSNRHDANTAIRIGTDTNRPLLDLLPDEFLDFRQVGVGFEVTPVSIISRASHRSVQSMTGKGASTQTYVSMGSIGLGAPFEKQGVVFRKHGRQNEIRHLLGDHAVTRFRFHIGPIGGHTSFRGGHKGTYIFSDCSPSKSAMSLLWLCGQNSSTTTKKPPSRGGWGATGSCRGAQTIAMPKADATSPNRARCESGVMAGRDDVLLTNLSAGTRSPSFTSR